MAAEDERVADLAERVLQVSGRLTRQIRARWSDEEGLTLSQDWVIALIKETPMSGADLARAQGVRIQTMSTAIAGLEQLGYVRREPDPGDRRRIVLHPTPEGLGAHERVRAKKQRWFQEVIGAYRADDLDALAAGLDILERIASI